MTPGYPKSLASRSSSIGEATGSQRTDTCVTQRGHCTTPAPANHHFNQLWCEWGKVVALAHPELILSKMTLDGPNEPWHTETRFWGRPSPTASPGVSLRHSKPPPFMEMQLTRNTAQECHSGTQTGTGSDSPSQWRFLPLSHPGWGCHSHRQRFSGLSLEASSSSVHTF